VTEHAVSGRRTAAGNGSPRAWPGRPWHRIVLSVWTAAWFADMAAGGGIARVFFRSGTAALFGEPGPFRPPGGLHLYASNPSLQIGPLSSAVAEVLRHLGPDNGVTVAEILLTAAGALIWDTIGARRPWPLWSLLSILALTVTPILTRDPQILGQARLAIVVAFTAVLLAGPSRWVWQTGRRPWPAAAPAGPALPGTGPGPGRQLGAGAGPYVPGENAGGRR